MQFCTITEFKLEYIIQNCKNLKSLSICEFMVDISHNNGRNVRTKNELVNLTYLEITHMRFPKRWVDFLTNFIQACHELVYLNIKCKSFQFVTYSSICM